MIGGIEEDFEFADLMAAIKSLFLNFPSDALAWDKALAIWKKEEGKREEGERGREKEREWEWGKDKKREEEEGKRGSERVGKR